MRIPDPTPVVVDDNGDDTHPSFGVVRLFKPSSMPGRRLFQSSIPHQHYVTLEIAEATRIRDGHHDHVHGKTVSIVSIAMSEAQWGAMVSSFGHGGGTPVTIDSRGLHRMPGVLDDEPRLNITAREVGQATRQHTVAVTVAVQAVVAAFDAKAGRREMGAVINTLANVLGNLPVNMQYAADQLTRHAEEVVTGARADIEAMVQDAARRQGIATPDGMRSLGTGQVFISAIDGPES